MNTLIGIAAGLAWLVAIYWWERRRHYKRLERMREDADLKRNGWYSWWPSYKPAQPQRRLP